MHELPGVYIYNEYLKDIITERNVKEEAEWLLQ